ncbi:uncharacterized protein LOC18010899 [Eutrema salsugineum]|nr:uncharacterized protein LOC18010899 [Eutrema salsugineum]
MGHFLETDFQGDGALNVEYVRVRLLLNIDSPLRFQRLFQFGKDTSILKFRYEKLKGFCSVCGLMVHEAAECPAKNAGLVDEPNDDDNDPHENHPPGFTPPRDNIDQPPTQEKNKTDEVPQEPSGNASKKRKTEAATQSSLLCCERRQAFFFEDYEEHASKRKRT